MKHRTKIVAAVAVAIAFCGGYAGYWFYVAGKLDQGIDDWASFQRQSGLILDFERTPISGFPFAFSATFRKPHIAGAFGGQAFDWQGPDVEARVSPFDLRSMTVTGPGHHIVDFGAGPATIDAAALEVRLGVAGNGTLSTASVTASGAALALPDGKMMAADTATALLQAPPNPPKADADPLLQFAFDAKDVKLPEGTVLLTADPLSQIQIAGTVKGPMPIAPIRQALAAWRDAGGTVEVASFALAQATLSLTGSATVALDETLQPIVAANLKARGLAETIDLLAEQHRIYPEDAQKMKLFVKGAERDVPGGYKEVATGLTVQGGYLAWGPFKLAQVPPIAWP